MAGFGRTAGRRFLQHISKLRHEDKRRPAHLRRCLKGLSPLVHGVLASLGGHSDGAVKQVANEKLMVKFRPG